MDQAKSESAQQGSTLRHLPEVVASLASLAGLLTAVCWVLGRVYLESSLSARMIPSSMIAYDSTDYVTSGFFYLLHPALPALLMLAGLLGIGAILSFVISWFKSRRQTKTIDASAPLDRSVTQGLTITKSLFIFLAKGYYGAVAGSALVLIVAAFFNVMGGRMSEQGQEKGRRIVVAGTQGVRIVASQPLGLPVPNTQATEGDTTLYVYTLHMLEQRDGHYFVFASVNPETCRPNEVYVVQEAQVLPPQLIEVTPLLPDCAPQR